MAILYCFHSTGAVSCSACIRAMDLIRIADRMLKENMQYAQVRVIFDENHDDYDGLVRISAIPTADSDDVTIYPEIKGMLTLDIDDDDL